MTCSRNVRAISGLRIASSVIGLLCACQEAVRPISTAAGVHLQLIDALPLATTASTLTADGSRLLIVESGGGRLVWFDSSLSPFDTLVLDPRLVGVRGAQADRFYVYLYDDARLYRLRRSDGRLETWLNNIQVGGLALRAPGEALVSDIEHRAVLYKALFSESRRFADPGSIAEPGNIAPLGNGSFAVASGSDAIVRIDGAGNVEARNKRPVGTDVMIGDGQGLLYLLRRGARSVWRMSGSRLERFDLDDVEFPDAIAVTEDTLVVLDRASRLVRYRLPPQ
jgi:hypothetical protein